MCIGIVFPLSQAILFSFSNRAFLQKIIIVEFLHISQGTPDISSYFKVMYRNLHVFWSFVSLKLGISNVSVDYELFVCLTVEAHLLRYIPFYILKLLLPIIIAIENESILVFVIHCAWGETCWIWALWQVWWRNLSPLIAPLN